MIAITCTQCGATLENVSERSTIIECQYCGAQILLPERDKKPVVNAPVEAPDFGYAPKPQLSAHKAATIVALVLVIPFMMMLYVVISRERSAPTYVRADSTPYVIPSPYPSPSSWSWTANTNTPAKPFPVVDYQPRMSWDGPNDLEHFEDPEVDLSTVSNLTSEEVEKTVFKNRVVKLRVVINTEGEIDEVETISGHPILVAAATQSAKRSIFTSRSKPTKRVLTYTFRVLKD